MEASPPAPIPRAAGLVGDGNDHDTVRPQAIDEIEGKTMQWNTVRTSVGFRANGGMLLQQGQHLIQCHLEFTRHHWASMTQVVIDSLAVFCPGEVVPKKPHARVYGAFPQSLP